MGPKRLRRDLRLKEQKTSACTTETWGAWKRAWKTADPDVLGNIVEQSRCLISIVSYTRSVLKSTASGCISITDNAALAPLADGSSEAVVPLGQQRQMRHPPSYIPRAIVLAGLGSAANLRHQPCASLVESIVCRRKDSSLRAPLHPTLVATILRAVKGKRRTERTPIDQLTLLQESK